MALADPNPALCRFCPPGNGGRPPAASRRRVRRCRRRGSIRSACPSHRRRLRLASSCRQCIHPAPLDLDDGGGLLTVDLPLSRRPVGRHDPRRHRRRLFHSPLLIGAHGTRRRVQPLLRLYEPLCRLHADARAGGQPPASLSRLGRGGAVQLPPHRILVPRCRKHPRRQQGLHRHPRGRHGACHRTDLPFPAARHAQRSRKSCPGRRHSGRAAPKRPPGQRFFCWAARWANRRSFRCRPGCPMPWRARAR